MVREGAGRDTGERGGRGNCEGSERREWEEAKRRSVRQENGRLGKEYSTVKTDKEGTVIAEKEEICVEVSKGRG